MKDKNIFSKIIDFILSIIDGAGDFFRNSWIFIKNHVKSFFIRIGNTKFFAAIKNGINFFKVNVLKTDSLKNHVLLRYLYKDLFLYFIVAFLFFFMIFFVNQILLTVESLLSQSAPFADVMRIMFYSLPFVIAQSAPFATLVGFLLCLGGMVANNEILIFRASGLSFGRILRPVIVMGLLISIVSFFINDYLLPLGTVKYNQLMREIMNAKPSIELESNSVKRLDKSHVVIGNVNGEDVSDVIIFDNENGTDRIIVAGPSSLTGGNELGVLMKFFMNDALIFSVDVTNPENYDVLSSKKAIYNIFDASLIGETEQSAREMTTYDLIRTIEQMKIAVKEDPSMDYILNVWIMELHKKFSIPFASIFFAFLAFSIAFQFKKHSSQTTGLVIGIIICVLYWAMQITGQLLVVQIRLDAFWCIWVPNFLLGIFGLIFSFRLLKK